MEDKIIGENELCFFLENAFTHDWKDGYRSVAAKSKDTGEMDFLLLKDGRPVYFAKSAEAIFLRHEIYKKIDSEK